MTRDLPRKYAAQAPADDEYRLVRAHSVDAAFKAIEAAILKNKAYAEFDKLSDLARKSYPKSMLADYELGQMYEKQGDYKRAAKAYQSGFQKEEIGDLTKDFMLEKADEMKGM